MCKVDYLLKYKQINSKNWQMIEVPFLESLDINEYDEFIMVKKLIENAKKYK